MSALLARSFLRWEAAEFAGLLDEAGIESRPSDD